MQHLGMLKPPSLACLEIVCTDCCCAPSRASKTLAGTEMEAGAEWCPCLIKNLLVGGYPKKKHNTVVLEGIGLAGDQLQI